ncbi:MAG: hypothetical protein ACT4P1_12370 [Sporichthyaceae bacterium]
MNTGQLVASTAAAALVAGGLLATAGSAGAAPADHKQFTIRVLSVQTQYDDDVTDPDSINNGDSFTFRGRLQRQGTTVGSERGRCVISNVIASSSGDPNPGADYTCKITVSIKGSKIKVRGTDRQSFNIRDTALQFPIIDGTKRFANAEGTFRMTIEGKRKRVLKFTADD